MTEPTISIGDKEAVNWAGISVNRALSLVSSSFEARLVEATADDAFEGTAAAAFAANLPVVIRMDEMEIFQGYPDDQFEISISTAGRTTNLKGRSRTQDIADSNIGEVDFGEEEPETITLDALIGTIWRGSPNIVTGDNGGTALEFIRPKPDEKVAAYIDRMVSRRGLVLTDNEDGDLVVMRVAETTEAVELSAKVGNLKRLTYRMRTSPLYKTYVWVASAKEDGVFSEGEVANVRSEFNSGIFGDRTRTNYAEISQDWTEDTMREFQRHDFLRTQGTSLQITAEVPGVRTPAGELWKTGMTVRLSTPQAEGKYIVAGARFSWQTSTGYTTTLKLTLEDAFLPQAQAPPNQQQKETKGLFSQWLANGGSSQEPQQ